MMMDNQDQPEDGFFHQHTKLQTLERQLFAHVRELGDLRRVGGLEEVLFCVLADQIDTDLAMDLSRIMVTHAFERVIRDPMQRMSSVPHGISRAERFAAFFEPGCPLCESKVDLDPVDEAEPDDDCACCESLVREWRTKHADALRRGRAAAARK